jgi:hypothetical protein
MSPRARRTLAAGLTALGAVLLVVEAGRVTAAAVSRLSGDAVLHRVQTRAHAVSPAGLRRLIDSRNAARAWQARPEDARVVALAQLLLDGPAAAAPAARRLGAALAAAPADPYAWTRLALVRLHLGAPVQARAARAMAARTGPRAPGLANAYAGLDRALARAGEAGAADARADGS